MTDAREMALVTEGTPYPRTRKQAISAAAVLLLVSVLVAFACLYMIHRTHQRILGTADIRRAAGELTSYAGAAKFVAHKAHDGRATQPYIKAYSQGLEESTRKTTKFIATHHHRHYVDDEARKVLSLGKKLDDSLKKFGKGHASEYVDLEKQFSSLAKKLDQLERHM